MSENLAVFSIKEQEDGKLELHVEGRLSQIAALIAGAIDDDPDVEKAIVLALMAVEARKMEQANKAQLN